MKNFVSRHTAQAILEDQSHHLDDVGGMSTLPSEPKQTTQKLLLMNLAMTRMTKTQEQFTKCNMKRQLLTNILRTKLRCLAT